MSSHSVMHREVIRWLQTLELSSALANPRRDLMNGFVVAEILSRHDKNLALHSFDTGSALARRLDNWKQIERYLKQKQCKDVTGELVRDVMSGAQGAAFELIDKLYTFFTKRALKGNAPREQAAKASEEGKPAFMRPTAAELVRLQNNNTAQRLGMLTGDIDEKHFIEKNATVVQKQRELVQTDKKVNHTRYEHQKLPMKTLISMVKHTGGDGTLGGTGAGGSGGGGGDGHSPSPATNRARQRIQAARQVSLRTHANDLVEAFQQRQQHERDEIFRAQFDPDEDVCRAFTRVIARPLQASGHFALALELGGLTPEQAAALPAVDCAPSSPGFPRADLISVIVAHWEEFPAVALDACFEQLAAPTVKHNAARLLQQRPDDAVHLVLLLDLALSSRNPENVVRVCHIIEEVGYHLSRLDPTGRTFGVRDELIAGVCPRIGDVINVAASSSSNSGSSRFFGGGGGRTAANEQASAFAKMILAFTNNRDADAVKRVLELVTKSAPEPLRPRVEAVVGATIFHHFSAADLRAAGIESLAAFHASALLHRASPAHAACGWEIFRCVAPTSPAVAATALHFASQLALGALAVDQTATVAEGGAREHWECLLAALQTVVSSVIAHHGVWSDDDGSDAAAENGNGNGNGNGSGGGNSGAELLDLVEVTAVRLFEAVQRGPSELERRAAYCAVAPLLRSDLLPSLSVAFVQAFLDLAPVDRDELLRGRETALEQLPALPSCTGKAEPFVAAGLAGLWPVEELLLILKVLAPSLSSLQLIEMLSALLVDETVARHQPAWEDALRFAKTDLVNAVRNPVELRDVPDAYLPRCQQLAGGVLATLFSALNPEEAASQIAAQQQAAAAAAGTDEEDFGDDSAEPSPLLDETGNMVFTQQQQQPQFDSPTMPNQRVGTLPYGAVDWVSTL